LATSMSEGQMTALSTLAATPAFKRVSLILELV
jgi:hypothetical protein